MVIIKIFKDNKDILLIIISSLGNIGSLALFWFFGAFFLTKESFGQITLILSICSTTSSLSVFGFGFATLTFGSRDQDKKIIPSFNAVVFLLALLFGLVIGIILKHWWEYIIMVLGYTAYTMTSNDKIACKKYVNYAIWQFLCGFFMFIFGIIAILLELSPLIVGILYTFPPLLMGKTFYYYTFKGLESFQITVIKQNFRSITLLGGFAILRNFVNYLDKIIVGFWLGLIVLGEYQLVFQIYLLLQFLPGTFLYYFIPEESSKSVLSSTLHLSIFLSIVLTIVTILGSNLMVNWIFPDYINVIPVIYIVSFSVPLAAIANISVSRLIAYNKQGYLVLSYILSIITQYLVMLILVPIINLQGLGVGLLLNQVILLLITSLGVRQYKVNIKKC